VNEFLTTYENYQQKLAYKPRHPTQQESNLSVQFGCMVKKITYKNFTNKKDLPNTRPRRPYQEKLKNFPSKLHEMWDAFPYFLTLCALAISLD
jgi:hypothetical protein